MKLKKFTPDTLPSANRIDERPAIKLKEVGLITINVSAVKLMGLKANDEVVFVQDEEAPECWYLSKQKGGWKARNVKDTEMLCIQSAALVKNIYTTCQINPGKELVKMLLAGTPTEEGKQTYWGILTNTAVWRSKI